nr:type II toxin-antitoxin system VapC family toxin [uncultured Actinotalea sp.]
MAHYLDTSALTKLVVAEPETPALHTWVTARSRVLVVSDLARTELLRAVRRVDVALAVPARSVLDAVVLLRATPAVFESAARLDPPTLRTLDAVHLAAALTLGDDLEAVVTYDDRLAEACRAYGVAVLAPA